MLSSGLQLTEDSPKPQYFNPPSAPPHLRVSGSVLDRDAGVVADPGQLVAGGGEGYVVDPPSRANGELPHAVPEGHLLAPGGGRRLLFNLLHVGGEHPERKGGRGDNQWTSVDLMSFIQGGGVPLIRPPTECPVFLTFHGWI